MDTFDKSSPLYEQVKINGIFILIVLAGMFNGCKGQPDCSYKGGQIDYLSTLKCEGDYTVLKGKPLTEKYGQVNSVKLIYQLKNHTLYFVESKKYPLHFKFCEEVLENYEGLAYFNSVNYQNSHYREYILANLNYYSSCNIFCLEFFNGDEVTAQQIKMLYDSIKRKAPVIASRLKLLVNTPEIEAKLSVMPSIPLITVTEIYNGQKYQTLTTGKAYGYLRIVDKKNFKKYLFNKHDIIVTNTIPNILPVVAGIITVPFQTPLCHLSVLCNNRGTPNAAFRLAFTDENILSLENKLVEYEVTADSFTLKDASYNSKKIVTDWKKDENKKIIKLAFDIKSSALLNVSKLYQTDTKTFGAKAANFGELDKIRLNNRKQLPLPEGAFAIPFYWYKNHLRTNGIEQKLDSLIHDMDLLNDYKLLIKKLKEIRDLIKKAPLDPILVKEIANKIATNKTSYKSYRFRSSTNAEDIKGFNGAGLYVSKTVTLGDEKKTIEKAVKQVWASLWDERAFVERAHFNFDQSSVFMGILVHRAFGDELANGVAITKHLYRDNYPAYTVNVQKGETSVVSPPDSIMCDQLIVGLGAISHDEKITFEYVSRSNISSGKPVLTQNQVEELVEYLTAIKVHFYSFEPRAYMNGGEAYERFAMDVEFKVDKFTGKIYIKQARSY